MSTLIMPRTNHLSTLEQFLLEFQPYLVLAIEVVRFLRGGLGEVQSLQPGHDVDFEALSQRIRANSKTLESLTPLPALRSVG